MTLDRLKTLTDVCTGWIGVVALVSAGAFAAIQYLDKIEADRVKVTLDFVERFNKESVFDAREAIDKAWDERADQISTILTEPSSHDAYHKFVLETIDAEELGRPLDLVLTFYQTLEVCIERSICDAASTLSFFQDDAKAFFNQHYAWIQIQRHSRKDPDFGSRLEQLVRRR